MDIDHGNAFFQVKHHRILDGTGGCIVGYFGVDEEIAIPDEIETIDPFAFTDLFQLHRVVVGAKCKFLCDGYLRYCTWLFIVSLAPDSHLRRIGKKAFLRCEIIRSVTIPPTVEVIGQSGFGRCQPLPSSGVVGSATFVAQFEGDSRFC
jgi:hypothetical protein